MVAVDQAVVAAAAHVAWPASRALSPSSRHDRGVGDHHVVVDVLADRLAPHRWRPCRPRSCGAMSLIGDMLKPQHARGPGARPSRTSAGCRPPPTSAGAASSHGLGSTLRGGTLKNSPSKRVLLGAPHLGELADHLVPHRLGDRGVGDVEAGDLAGCRRRGRCRTRSGRSERWSSIATRSATRTGWFTGGVMLKIPDPRWIRSVTAAR